MEKEFDEIRKEVHNSMIKKNPFSLELLESAYPSRYWEIIDEITLYAYRVMKQRKKPLDRK